MSKDIVELKEDISQSPLYSEDLAPVPAEKRTWSTWNMAAIWVGMAVCIPTYLLAAGMIKSGLSWLEALIIIGLANVIITIPMVLNGHAGVKYGIPFPVLGRSSFGINGIHIASVVRGIVACGWFGIQTWIGGLALYAIWHAAAGTSGSAAADLSYGKFIAFGIFWLMNIYFIWKGTESIKWLEQYSAPILVIMGIALIGWGASRAGGFGKVLENSKAFGIPAASLVQNDKDISVEFNPYKTAHGKQKAEEYQLSYPVDGSVKTQAWQPIPTTAISLNSLSKLAEQSAIVSGEKQVQVKFRSTIEGQQVESSVQTLGFKKPNTTFKDRFWAYVMALTAMVGFWATMSLSIADITRYTSTQKEQAMGQFIGLPGTMVLYSFVGIFVTSAALINFPDVLIAEDAPWDPVALLSKFESPVVVIIAQLFMIIATLSTNIAANVIAPANAFSNLFPKLLSFRGGGLVAGVIGILIMPWSLMNYIMPILIFISGLLGPVLAILLCDYYFIRKKNLDLAALFDTNGEYAYGGSGFNPAAMIALGVGVALAIIGYWVKPLEFLYSSSWFTGFGVSFLIYYLLMRKKIQAA